MKPGAIYREKLDELRNSLLLRELQEVTSPLDRVIKQSGRELLVFCSNNYLSLANDERIINAVIEAVRHWGLGSGGSRLICGHTAAHEHLQSRLASLLGKEAVLLFPSGYSANTTVLSCLPGPNDLVLIDKLVHASIIDGARSGPAVVRTWPHGQFAKLRRLLERGGYGQAFIVSDSLFSMDGDFANLEELVAIKQRYNAYLMLDEAHAFGCIGPEGRGWAAQSGLLNQVDIFVATLSKALGGAGGFVATSKVMIDFLINTARGFIYTTAQPAILCLAAETALDIIQNEPQRRQRLIENGQLFRQYCREAGLNTGESESYIVPLILGRPDMALAVSQKLLERGFWVPAIRPPTVSPGSSRLRISLMSSHTEEDILKLSRAIQDIHP